MTTISNANSSPDRSHHILIVEDDTTVREMLQSMLDTLGLSCSAAVNGQQAIALLEREIFTLIISDIVMPGMDGLQLLKHVKIISPWTAVIIMTGFSDDHTRAEALQAGAADFLQKPFSFSELQMKIARIFPDHYRARIRQHDSSSHYIPGGRAADPKEY